MIRKDKKAIIDTVPWLLVGLTALLIAAICCGGCTATKYVPMETVRIEYREADTAAIYNRLLKLFESKREKETRSDSLVDRTKETVVLRENGDTARHDRERVVYVASRHEKELEQQLAEQDSVINEMRTRLEAEKVDSVPVHYPVERKLSRWEQTKMDYGGVALGALAVVLCAAVVWLTRKFRK